MTAVAQEMLELAEKMRSARVRLKDYERLYLSQRQLELAETALRSAPQGREALIEQCANVEVRGDVETEAEASNEFQEGYAVGYQDTVYRFREAIRTLALTPADGAGEVPDGATHMRRPEYITAWLFDRQSTMPIWLIEKYKSDPLPDEKIGHYATAIDGEFWRWFDPAKFEEMFVALAQAQEPGEDYLVWSNQHRAWWRANSAGYAIDVREAGHYSREEAISISGKARDGWGKPDDTPDELAIPISALPEKIRLALRPERSAI